MKKHFLYWLAAGLVVVIGCQKEESFEVGNTPSHGTLQSDVSGDCLPKTVNGVYEVATPLVPGTNTITVDVNVTQTGNYTITTDTVNGFYFNGTGSFTASGNNTVTLRGNGTPFTAGTFNFVVSYDSTFCDIQVVVVPAGTGAAVFTLQGAPNACTGATVAGTYATGVALGASNTATINVNVTTIGTYNISTTFQGMTFSKVGVFTTTGVQPVILNGSGTPTTGGVNTVPVTVGTSTCTFDVTVSSAGAGTLGGAGGACTPSTVNGTYTIGTLLVAANTVTVQVNVTTAGVCTISTNTVTGFSFSFSGNLAIGTQNVILAGTGTPSTAGPQTFTATFGTSTCTFVVNVVAAPPGAGTCGGAPGACTPATVNGTYTVGTILGAPNSVTIQVTVTTAGVCNITTNAVTGFSFAFNGNLALGTQNVTLAGTGTPTTAGPQTFTVTFSGSTCTFVVTVVAPLSNDYFPRTTNSNWTYMFDGDPADTLLRIATSNTIMALGNQFTIFMGNDGTGLDSSGYYRRAAGNYFEWFDAGSFIGYDNPVWGEYIMVKDDVPVPTNWKSSGFAGTAGGNPFNIRFSFTVIQKDVPITVASTTYQNVIVVEEKYELEVTPGVWQDLTSSAGYGKSYYARGIGLIKYEALDPGSTIVFRQELTRYQVF